MEELNFEPSVFQFSILNLQFSVPPRVTLPAMHYVCLAAGKGTRFGDLGRYLQKCMYPVGLKPFVELSVQNLLAAEGFVASQLTFVVGHHAGQLRAYFGSAYEGLPVDYVEQTEQLGTGHALYSVNEVQRFDGPVLAWLADMYVPAALFERVLNHPQVNVQTVGPGLEGEKNDLKVTTDGDLIIKAWNGDEPLYDIGLWKLSPKVLKLMTKERHGEYRMVPNLQYAIDQGHQVGVVRASEWLHLGGTLPTPEVNVMNITRRILELRGAS